MSDRHGRSRADFRARDERFRKAVLDNPDLTTLDLSERFGLSTKDVGRLIARLKLPKPPITDGFGDFNKKAGGTFARAMGGRR